MITDFLLRSLHAICAGMFSLLPSWYPTVDNATAYAMQQAHAWLAITDAFVPLLEIERCAQVTVALFGALLAFKFLEWVVRRIADVIP